MITNTRGMTLVEVMITLIISAIVVLGIMSFVSTASDQTREINLQQQLQQECSIINERVMRSVRNGDFICINSNTTAPASDSNVSKITVRKADTATISATFQITGDSLLMDGTRYLTGYLCRYATPASHFRVFQNGKHVELYLSLYQVVGRDTFYYTRTIGDVRCKN